MRKLTFIILLISTVAIAQRGYRDSNRIGIGAGITKLNIYTSNFTITPELGWIGGFSVRGNYFTNCQLIFGMFFLLSPTTFWWGVVVVYTKCTSSCSHLLPRM